MHLLDAAFHHADGADWSDQVGAKLIGVIPVCTCHFLVSPPCSQNSDHLSKFPILNESMMNYEKYCRKIGAIISFCITLILTEMPNRML